MFNKQDIKEIAHVSFPAVQEMILYMICTIFNTMMAGKYCGDSSVSAMGICYEIVYILSNIFIVHCICIGITSMIARYIGANKLKFANEYATLGFFIGFLTSASISVLIFIFHRYMLSLTGAEECVIELAIPFIKIASFGIFFYMMTYVLNSIFRGYGNTKTPLNTAFMVTITNILLDCILLFGLFGVKNLGIQAIAVSTTIAQILGFIYTFYYVIRHSILKLNMKYIINMDTKKIKELLILSVPSSLEEITFSISKLLGIFMVIHIGTTAFAAHQIASTIESVSITLGLGFSTAATTLVGIKIGQDKPNKALEYAYISTLIGTAIMLFCSILFLSGPYVLMNVFIGSRDLNVVRLGATCLVVSAFEQVPMSISLILGGALKGIGDTKTPFIVSFISCCLIKLPLLFYFIYILKRPLIYVWYVSLIQWCFDGSMIFILFRKKFKNKL